MALQSSGAISMSQIKDEFGGTGSHALSEYRALAGLGVSGIPASGAISFSQFHGKSNQVTTSVWVSSGYNQTTEVWIALHYSWWYSGNGTRWGTWGYHDVYHTWNTSMGVISGNTSAASRTWNGYTWKNNGSWFWLGNSGARHYGINQYQDQTTWIDTSSYQNQTITAQIST